MGKYTNINQISKDFKIYEGIKDILRGKNWKPIVNKTCLELGTDLKTIKEIIIKPRIKSKNNFDKTISEIYSELRMKI